MSGSVYVRTMWIPTKKYVFEARLGIGAGCEYRTPKRMTWREFKLKERKRRGPYWRYRNIQVMHRMNFDRRRYGK